jgi:hypothetical protein
MPRLVWDKIAEKKFEVGVSQGVLYVPSGGNAYGVPWNGLVGVDSSTDLDVSSRHLDGIKYLDVRQLGEYAATIRAFTYPKEFDVCLGMPEIQVGLLATEQPLTQFHFSYRTLVGNDVNDINLGYKIHVVWNAYVVPDEINFATLDASTEGIEFSWMIKATPSPITNFRPTAHLVIDSTRISAPKLAEAEKILYGSASYTSNLPSAQAFVTALAAV